MQTELSASVVAERLREVLNGRENIFVSGCGPAADREILRLAAERAGTEPHDGARLLVLAPEGDQAREAALVFGSCLGSFLNVCIWRLPLGESIVSVPSHCTKCGYEIPHSYNRKGNVVVETNDITPWLKKLRFGLNFVTADTIIQYRRKLEKTVMSIIPLKKIFK